MAVRGRWGYQSILRLHVLFFLFFTFFVYVAYQSHTLKSTCSPFSAQKCGNDRIISYQLPVRGTWAGGFGDRLMGIVTTWYLALLTGSCFNIEWTWPYNIHDFFDFDAEACMKKSYREGPLRHRADEDARVQRINSFRDERLRLLRRQGHRQVHLASDHKSWKVAQHSRQTRKPIIHELLSESSWAFFANGSFMSPKEQEKDIIFRTNARNWGDIVHHGDLQQTAHSFGLSGLSDVQLFKIGIESLLNNPTRDLSRAYETLLKGFDEMDHRVTSGRTWRRRVRRAGVPSRRTQRGSFIGVQIRTGGDGSEWEDPARQSLNRTTCFASQTARLCASRDVCNVFLTADHPDVSRLFKKELKMILRNLSAATRVSVLQTPGKIAHTDRSNVTGQDGSKIWLKQVLDWWALRHASELVISRSGFGETAAWSSNASVIRRLLLGNASDSCNFDDGIDDLSRVS